MRFDHIGGLDAAWRALAGQQVLVEPPLEITPQAVAETVARHKVEVLPATPSFLNLLLLAGADKNHDLSSLRVVPYGAESMPAGLLARLKSTLPQVSFIERFGTSETGALPVHGVGSGLVLGGEDSGYAWRIVEGALWVKSPVQALGYLDANSFDLEGDGWYRTGDLAEEMPGGAIRILGRQEETMNVGGEKVLPGEVENVLLAHPLVADCRVRPEPSAIMGQMVAADVVWSGPEKDSVTVKRMLHEFAAGLIAPHKLPARVRLVEAVDSTKNLKKLRNFRS
jgi:acyl-coenzyme A synthetase/AMP-(fatty) acid ligase